MEPFRWATTSTIWSCLTIPIRRAATNGFTSQWQDFNLVNSTPSISSILPRMTPSLIMGSLLLFFHLPRTETMWTSPSWNPMRLCISRTWKKDGKEKAKMWAIKRGVSNARIHRECITNSPSNYQPTTNMINYGYHTHSPIVTLNSTNLLKIESVKIESLFRK